MADIIKVVTEEGSAMDVDVIEEAGQGEYEKKAKQPKLDIIEETKTENTMETEIKKTDEENNTLAQEDVNDDDSVEDNEEEDDDFLGLGWEDDDIALEDVPISVKKEPPQDISPLEYPMDTFQILDYLPPTHKYITAKFTSSQKFVTAYNRDVKILRENLPSGIWVRGYGDRLDLFSVLIAGPQNTPYEGSLFAFEVRLPEEYPNKPPIFHYISFNKHRINPNLYVEGKVCVSLLGTWHGQKQSEKWDTKNSTLLQVVLSIQALILVPQPYFNEPGYENSFGSTEGNRRSREYNERVVLNLLDDTVGMLKKPPSPWQFEITRFMKQFSPKTIERMEKWMNQDEGAKPDFPLYPVPVLSLRAALKQLKDAIELYCAAVAI